MGRKLVTRRQYRRLSQRASLRCLHGSADSELVVSNRYDHLDRRVQKITPEATHTFFYDGWMLIKEIVANTNGTTDVIEYHWGKDLSGTIGGAGGVGGLLYLKRNGAIYVPWYDAYGNVMGYWDAQGNVVAEYTYDAFGKLISSSGPMADVFSIRYSTKYFDPEIGFYYYGYRFYSPELKRWITRDPIGEEGGVNLYAMCENNCILKYDAIGLLSFNFMWRYPTQQESDRIKKISNEIAVYSDNFLRQISYFRASYFPQARSSNNVWFVPKEIDRTADLSKLPYALVQHFGLHGHRERGSLNMALRQIENRLKKEKSLQTYQNFRVSTCRNVLCRTGAIDALTTPFFIGVCENNLRDMSDGELRMLIGHEASHKFHGTQDYYYMYDEKKIYDAYSWGMIYGE